MKIEITISGLDKAVAGLGALASREARAAIAREAATELQRITEQNFTSTRLRPAPWAPLAASTLAGLSRPRKRAAKKVKAGASPLIDTSTLFKSFSVQNVSEGGAELESTQEYSVYHQFGTKTIPARPFVPLTGARGGEGKPTPAAERLLQRAALGKFKEAAARAGFKVS